MVTDAINHAPAQILVFQRVGSVWPPEPRVVGDVWFGQCRRGLAGIRSSSIRSMEERAEGRLSGEAAFCQRSIKVSFFVGLVNRFFRSRILAG